MSSTILPFRKIIYPRPIFVWVLAPFLETGDPNLDYYYDFSQSIEEYTRVFKELKLEWKWQPVSMNDYKEVIEKIVQDRQIHTPVVLNLCDGDEVNGTPGISVLKLLDAKGLVYSGANEHFYNITTSKIDMKRAFDKAGIVTPPWEEVSESCETVAGIFDRLGSPLIVKPAVSGGSMGVGIKSVVYNEAELVNQVQSLYDGYRGWNITSGGVIVESFINGPEFTSLIVGSHNQPDGCHIYPAVERRFHASLPENEQFLSFDRLWEIYEDESSMPGEENFYEYQAPETSLLEPIKQAGWDAYCAMGGTGYTRIDLRMDKATGKLYVLEVNAQCGLSDDENFTSIGAILRLSNRSFTKMIEEIINDAFLKKLEFVNPVISKKKIAKAKNGHAVEKIKEAG